MFPFDNLQGALSNDYHRFQMNSNQNNNSQAFSLLTQQYMKTIQTMQNEIQFMKGIINKEEDEQ